MTGEVIRFRPIEATKEEILTTGWRNSWKAHGIEVPPLPNKIESLRTDAKTLYVPDKYSSVEALPELFELFGDTNDFFKRPHSVENIVDHPGWRNIGITGGFLNLGLSETEAREKFQQESREGVTLNELIILRYLLGYPPGEGKMLRITGTVIDGKTLSVLFYKDKSFGTGFFNEDLKSPLLGNPSSMAILLDNKSQVVKID